MGMDKRRIIETLESMALNKGGTTGAELRGLAESLRKIETVGEVREAIARLAERRKADMNPPYIRIGPTLEQDRIGMDGGEFWANGKLAEAIDSIHPEPSDEPPSPDDIEPGMKVPTFRCDNAFIWPDEYGEFTGVIVSPEGTPMHFSWKRDGTPHGAYLDPRHSLDWQAYRKERGNG